MTPASATRALQETPLAPPEHARPPKSEDELMERARGLMGRSLGELATRFGRRVPDEPRRAKGFAGQLFELALGATAGSRSAPDFERIGVELKSVPVARPGVPTESTYVCTVDLIADPTLDWSASRARKKLARVLWMPIQADPALAFAERRLGRPILWSPDPATDALLRRDFDDLMEFVRLGHADRVTAHHGTALQIRPKGADATSDAWGVDEDGHRAKVRARGFYLRPTFTAAILATALRPGA